MKEKCDWIMAEGVATEVAVAVTLAAGCEVRAKVSAIGE